MSTAAPTRPKTTFPPETWERIKAEACKGASYPALARLFGPSPQVIANRAKNEQWPTPLRLAKRRRENGETGNGDEVALPKSKVRRLSAPVIHNNHEKDEQLTKDSISRLHTALLALVESPPADFQAAFAAVAQAAIAEGVRDVPAPRSIKELATWFDLWRKAAGLDAKAGAPGNAPLVNPLRTVSRRSGGAVVEAEVSVAPLLGSPEFAAWEV